MGILRSRKLVASRIGAPTVASDGSELASTAPHYIGTGGPDSGRAHQYDVDPLDGHQVIGDHWSP
jgi:hypothetical protein